jgi:hypothetical protein
MLMSELQIKDRTAARKQAALGNDGVGGMMLARAGIIFLAALLMTAIWAPILYVGGLVFGAGLDSGLMLRILLGIFILSLLGIALAMSAGESRDVDGPGPDVEA